MLTRYILIAEEKPKETVQYADFTDKKYPNDIKELLYNHCIRFEFQVKSKYNLYPIQQGEI